MEGQSDGDPALGRISNFALKRSEGDKSKITVDFNNIPQIVYDILKNDLYTDVSAEIRFYNGYGWYVSAVALLGADIPAVKVLEDIQQFIPHSESVAVAYSGDGFNITFSQPTIIGGNMPDNDNKKPEDSKTVDTLLNDNKKLQSDYTVKEAENQKLKKESEDKDKLLAEYRKKEVENHFKAKKEEILKPYKEDVDKMKLAPALLDKIEKHLDSQFNDKFTMETPLFLSPELAREVAQAYTEKVPGKQDYQEGRGFGSSKGDDMGDEENISFKIDKEIKLIQAESGRKMTYSEATDALIAKNPDLWQQYCDWTNEVHESGYPILMKQ